MEKLVKKSSRSDFLIFEKTDFRLIGDYPPSVKAAKKGQLLTDRKSLSELIAYFGQHTCNEELSEVIAKMPTETTELEIYGSSFGANAELYLLGILRSNGHLARLKTIRLVNDSTDFSAVSDTRARRFICDMITNGIQNIDVGLSLSDEFSAVVSSAAASKTLATLSLNCSKTKTIKLRSLIKKNQRLSKLKLREGKMSTVDADDLVDVLTTRNSSLVVTLIDFMIEKNFSVWQKMTSGAGARLKLKNCKFVTSDGSFALPSARKTKNSEKNEGNCVVQ